MRTVIMLALLLAPGAPMMAHAQDFESAAPGPANSAATFLDSGLSPSSPQARIEGLGVARFGLPELATRAVAASFGWRSLRVATGLSQTGDPALGWSAVGAAAGIANARWGAGVRGVARRDRVASVGTGPWGAEVGAGLWLSPAERVIAWASAPAVWTDGAQVPLVRGLAMGVSASGDGARAWFQHEARPDVPSGEASHRAGVELDAGSLGLWVEGLDAPLRAALGVRATAARITFGVRIVSHPLLGETARLTIALGGGPGPGPAAGP